MKFTVLAISILSLLAGCSSHSPISASAPVHSDSSKSGSPQISFGLYDIAKGPSISELLTHQPQKVTAAGISEPVSSRDHGDTKPVAESATSSAPNDRMVVKNGSLLLESASPVETVQAIARIAESKGGYVLNSEQSTTDVAADALDSVEISIRVASDLFEETMSEIRGSSTRLLAENIRGEDVTEEFLDLAARIRTQKALEQQYLDILKQAEEISDILTVQNHLTTVRTEIEKLEGRTKLLRDRTSYSTIVVSVKTAQALSLNSAGFVARLSGSMYRGLDAASGITLGIVTLLVGSLPLIVFLGLPSYWIWKRARSNESPATLSEIAKGEVPAE